MAKDIFGPEDPLGKTILINNSPFTVIGVMQRKRQSSTYGGPDATHAGHPPVDLQGGLRERPRERPRVPRQEGRRHGPPRSCTLNQVLGPRLGFDPEDSHAFGVWNTVEGQKMQEKILIGLEIFFGIIGALTLIIGGVGVANIMYAVVKERTKEIGVKMALGARSAWITGPFVLEGMVYTFLGGLFGALIAIVIVTGLGFVNRSRATTCSSFSAIRRCPGRSGSRRSRSSGPAACSPATSRPAAPRPSIPLRRCATNREDDVTTTS